jgi:broad specificity phosphatase PhoE
MISLAILVPICTIAIVGLSSALVVPPLPVLKNSYVALRHGQSEANIEGIISSDPAIGTTKHGLTISGRVQARKAATSLLEVCGRETVESLIFVSSDFVRARETAAECRDAIQRIISFETEPLGLDPWVCSDVIIDLGLRERFFGALDGCPLSRYNEVRYMAIR